MKKERIKSGIVNKLLISIKGKSYSFRQTMGAQIQYKRVTGKEVSEMDSSNVEDVMMFFYLVVKCAARADEIDFDFDFEDFCDCMDVDDFKNFMEEIADSKSNELTKSDEQAIEIEADNDFLDSEKK